MTGLYFPLVLYAWDMQTTYITKSCDVAVIASFKQSYCKQKFDPSAVIS